MNIKIIQPINSAIFVSIIMGMSYFSNKVVAITTQDKIGTAESFKVCDIKFVDTIITEISNKDASFEPYKALGIHIM